MVMKKVEQIPIEWKNISELFIALGDEQRQRILLDRREFKFKSNCGDTPPEAIKFKWRVEA
jgi:hypothetical protein